MYDPFLPGNFEVAVETAEVRDPARGTVFPLEIRRPAGERARTFPLVVFSHHSGGSRRSATYLTSHLAGHGYLVAAMDHSEVADPRLNPRDGETAEQRAARAQLWIASRVPDIRFLLDHLLASRVDIDARRIGIAGHSFGGWTALAAAGADPRIQAVAALAPAGNLRPKPGILPVHLDFAWGRDVPVLYLAAEDDVPIPLEGVVELFHRTPATRRMFILRRADHLHFIDNVESQHEAVRNSSFPGEASWIPGEMRPIAELCSGDQAHLFTRGLVACHMDAFLKESDEARRFLAGDIPAALAARGVDARAI